MAIEKVESLSDENPNGGVRDNSKYTSFVTRFPQARGSFPTSPSESLPEHQNMDAESQTLPPKTLQKQEVKSLLPITTESNSRIAFAGNTATPPTARNNFDIQDPKLMSEEEAKIFKGRQDAERFSKNFDAAQQGGKSLSCKDPEFARIMNEWKNEQLDRKARGIPQGQQQQEKKKRIWKKVFGMKPGKL
jgi:hypothetical protein